MTQDIRLRAHAPDIPQQSRPPLHAAKTTPIPIPRQTIRVRARVERPSLFVRGAARDGLEVVGVNDGVEGWFFVDFELGRGGGRRFGPFVRYGAFVDFAFEFGGVEVGGQDGGGVDGVVGGRGVAAGVLPDDCGGLA